MTSEIRPNAVIVADAAEGGILHLIDPEGQSVHQFIVPQGRHRASLWLDLVEPGYELQVGKGVVCFQPRMGVSRTAHPDALKSDANPDFKATSASRLEREMRIELAEMRAARLEIQKQARKAKAEEIDPGERIPDAKPMAKAKGDAQAKADAEAEAGVVE